MVLVEVFMTKILFILIFIGDVLATPLFDSHPIFLIGTAVLAAATLYALYDMQSNRVNYAMTAVLLLLAVSLFVLHGESDYLTVLNRVMMAQVAVSAILAVTYAGVRSQTA